MTRSQHFYEVRPRKDHRGVDLISDALPFGGADWIWLLELDVYLDAAQAPLKVPKHFVSAICSLIDSTPKLCRVDGRVAKGTFSILSLEPVDSLLDQLATFRACNFQR